MDVIDIINEKIRNSGVTITHIASNSGMSVDVLSKCLLRRRNMKADEFIRIAKTLALDVNSFIELDTK